LIDKDQEIDQMEEEKLRLLLLEAYAWISSNEKPAPGLCRDIAEALGYRREAGFLPIKSTDISEQSVLIVMEGEPRGKGRPRFSSRGAFVQVYTDADTALYEEMIQCEVLRMMGGQALVDKTRQIKRKTFIDAYKDLGGQPHFAATVPVRIEIEVRRPIRDSWNKKKKEAALAGLIAPTLKPDLDNIEKIWCDAFNHCLWKDDTQVVRVNKTSMFAEEPSVLVRVIPLDLAAA
jgi:Holliday junction resolvase RusA-like endonuclease